MQTVISKDGTSIAYDQVGQGPALILVPGAFSYRAFPGLVQLAELLAPHFTVIRYDRRGRGDSGDTKPYAVEREIEDLQALIDAAGGSAYVWGFSSGAILALKAAVAGLKITKLVVLEPPFRIDTSEKLPPRDFLPHVTKLIEQGRRAEAIKYFMTAGMGAPAFVVTLMRFMPGAWPKLMAVAHTLPYDAALADGYVAGQPLRAEEWATVTMPTLVMDGSKSPISLRRASQALAPILPNARSRTLEGFSHTNPSMKVVAPVLTEFFS